jgi:hypothetical protein
MRITGPTVLSKAWWPKIGRPFLDPNYCRDPPCPIAIFDADGLEITSDA